MIENFDKALAVATQMHMSGQRDKAEPLYHQLMVMNPNHPFLNFALGTFYTDQESWGTAIPLLMRALDMEPNNSQAWNNLGAAFKANHMVEEAEELLTKAQQLDEKNPATYANLSGLYINEGCPEKSVPWAKKGLLIDPESPQLHNHMALALLELGEWEDAWPHWEYRVKLPGWYQREFPPHVKKWHGQKVKSLALSGEQGIGDEILFCSIVPQVRELIEDKLFIECTQRLQPLFERSFDCITYPSHQELLFAEHKIAAHLQLGSLPRLFRPNPDACPGTPFLKPHPGHLDEMRARLARLGPPPYVGIAWRGGTRKTHAHVRETSLADWKGILGVDGVTFVSVQYGPSNLEAAPVGVAHWADAVVDFDRHTSLIAACDLVISVCQTAVHQSGGLGVPCWCLTPHKVAWRYGVWGGERMPWYSSVKLIRQGPDMDWTPVYAEAAADLQAWVNDRKEAYAA